MENEVRKYGAEVFPVDVDFSSGMGDGEAIISGSSTVIAYDGDEVAAGIVKTGSIAASGQKLFATLENGAANKVYRLEFKAVSDAANVFIHNLQLRILSFRVKP